MKRPMSPANSDKTFAKICDLREFDYLPTPELTQLINKAPYMVKGLYDFVCSMVVLVALCKAGIIDQDHDNNRGKVWDPERDDSFLKSFANGTNSYIPVFSVEFNRNGKPTLLVWDANNRTYTLKEFFAGCKLLQKEGINLPKTFYGKLFIKTPREECKEYYCNINNTEAQSAGEIFSSASGKTVENIKNYINSSTGIYAKKGRSYRYLDKCSNTRKKLMEYETKNVFFFNDKLTKGADNLNTDKFHLRERLNTDDVEEEALSTLRNNYYEKITSTLDEIHKTHDSYRIDPAHFRWLLLFYAEMNQLGGYKIKNNVKFLKSLVNDLKAIQKIDTNEINSQKKILKIELSHQLNDSRVFIFKHIFKKMKRSPSKYGL